MSINNTKILDLIQKENELKTQLALYKTINNDYALLGNIDTQAKKNTLTNLNKNMETNVNKIKSLAINIKSLREYLKTYNIKIDNLKTISDNNLKNLLGDINQESIKMNKMNKMNENINSFNGSNQEFSKNYISQNINYMVLLFFTILLIFSIITSMYIPYQTNLEKFIFIILIIVCVYYMYMYISKTVHSIK